MICRQALEAGQINNSSEAPPTPSLKISNAKEKNNPLTPYLHLLKMISLITNGTRSQHVDNFGSVMFITITYTIDRANNIDDDDS